MIVASVWNGTLWTHFAGWISRSPGRGAALLSSVWGFLIPVRLDFDGFVSFQRSNHLEQGLLVERVSEENKVCTAGLNG